MTQSLKPGLSTAQVAAQLDSQQLEHRHESFNPYGHDKEEPYPEVPSPECPECPYGN